MGPIFFGFSQLLGNKRMRRRIPYHGCFGFIRDQYHHKFKQYQVGGKIYLAGDFRRKGRRTEESRGRRRLDTWMSLSLSKQINGEKNMQLREARQRQDSNFVRVYYIYGLEVRRKSFNLKK